MFFSFNRSCCCNEECLDPNYYYYYSETPEGCGCTANYIRITKSFIDGGGEICFNNSCELIISALCCENAVFSQVNSCDIPGGETINDVGYPS